MNEFITIGVSFAVGIASSYITFRLQFERFKAMDERRELDWSRWRERVDKDLQLLNSSASVTQLALLTQAVASLVKRVEDLWKYTVDIKHLQVDPYVRATDLLKQRMDEWEKR